MSEVCTPPLISTDQHGNEWVRFGPDHTLGDIARWLMTNEGEAEEVVYLLLGMLGKPLATMPSAEMLTAISQSLEASLNRRRLGKNVIDGENRKVFEQAARWAEINRAAFAGLGDEG